LMCLTFDHLLWLAMIPDMCERELGPSRGRMDEQSSSFVSRSSAQRSRAPSVRSWGRCEPFCGRPLVSLREGHQARQQGEIERDCHIAQAFCFPAAPWSGLFALILQTDV
jgi:hypothetical protein